MSMPVPNNNVATTLSDFHAASSPPIVVHHPSHSTPSFLYGSSPTPSAFPPAGSRPPRPSLNLSPPSSQAGHHRASSAPPTPAPSSSGRSGSEYQCSGVTKAGKRCTRMLKAPHPSIFPAGEFQRYCFQHIKEVVQPSGHNIKGNWVGFSDWIPSYLDDDTRANLMNQMTNPISVSDKPGYIYAYEIRDPKTPKEIHIKVGRAENLVKRLDQWSKQCGSREVVLRGWWPGSVVDNGDTGPSLLKGRVLAGEKGKHCHRLERLIHLELSDLVVNKVYLRPEFLKTRNGAPSVPPHIRRESSSANKSQRVPCSDCGQVHKEIFTFTKIENGRLKGKEWDMIVRPVIEKWGRFVEDFT
ncbi:uncharacterized protein EI90DRAFT_3028152 [Cantharellus anzutake]|uniref:uncharacterized protein n=1 Tax=Cantharellus anzutake TaxID=1750568 RepID=UPI001904835F|nr:uncharacterized protein EI90DRAFT_3028152 [Cantharellus anzutake]KAF8344065.1 hypothetical protein EI90DRAFT_3028152 [Cantharellus anzutake]